MPVIRKRLGAREHPDHNNLVAELVRHLKDEPNLPEFPKIIEEPVRLSSTLRVYVFWDAWGSVPELERSEIILEAYEQARGKQEMLRVSVAMGLTPLEGKQLGIEP